MRGVFIEAAVNNIKHHLVLGALFASFVIFLFLANWRTTLIASIAIPTSIISAFALMAALGLLPMALSTEVGAETSRPFAVVIIGGLITATAVTLLVLPVLYPWFEPPAEGPRT